MGVTSDSYGNLLSSVLLNKLPSEFRLIVSREIRDTDRWNFDAIMKAAEEEVHARERASPQLQKKPNRQFPRFSLEEPLTPSHLMVGRRLMSLPDRVYRDNLDDDVVDTALYNRRAQHLSRTLDRFWLRWKNESLLELREAHRYSHGNSDSSHASVGDIVVVRTEGQPRGFWKVAKVERTIAGQDGVARGAVVRVAGRRGRTHTLSRPIQHLFPLEINCQVENPEQQNQSLQDDPERSNGPRRSTRGAARTARDAIMAQALAQTD